MLAVQTMNSKCDTDRKVSNSSAYLLTRVYVKGVPS